jgi:hypothetical protein
MITAELGLATKSAATLSTSIAMKALVYHGPGKRAWEDKPRPAIQDPGDAIVRIAISRWGSKASWARVAPCTPFLEILPLQSWV